MANTRAISQPDLARVRNDVKPGSGEESISIDKGKGEDVGRIHLSDISPDRVGCRVSANICFLHF